MNASATDWPTAIAILASGLILGSLVIYFIRRTRPAKLDALLDQIRKTKDADEKARLEREAANVLRGVDEKPQRPAFASQRPMLVGYLWGFASATVVGGIAFYGYTYAQPRTMPGATAPMTQNATAAAPAVEPKDLEGHIELAKSYFAQNNLMGVYEQTNAALAIDPDEPRALTYNAIVKIAMGQLEEAKQMLDRALARDPKFLDAWVALASVEAQAGNRNEATAAIEKAIAQRPDEEKRLREVLAKLLTPQPKATPAADHPPIDSDRTIHITLAIEGPIAAKGGVVYVMARADGQNDGHPVAVKRVSTDSFPVTIDLGSADSMMGGPLPPMVNVEARLDADGDAATKESGDPKAAAINVSAGSTVTLTLK